MTDLPFSAGDIVARIRGASQQRDGSVRATIEFRRNEVPIFTHVAIWADAAERAAVAARLGVRAGMPAEAFGDDLQRIESVLPSLCDATSLGQQLQSQFDSREWPAPPGDAAYHGLAGSIIDAIDPHTESDRVAVLTNLLVAFGNCIGADAHFQVGAVRHGLNLFATLVGDTAKARKGDSWPPVQDIFKVADPIWTRDRVVSGMSSGEGLTWQVRDSIEKRSRSNKGSDLTEIVDVGVEDKRLLVFEPEFARVLSAMARTGNTLSPVVRHAWDHGNLNTLTKNSPAKATGAHISIIAHITEDELRRALAEVEVANGFANRYFWVGVRRSKRLPDPEPFNIQTVNALARDLHDVIEFGRHAGEIRRDAETRTIWSQVYDTLSDARLGLFGSIVARAEAQAARLAAVYAVLDGSAIVHPVHLKAALELWGYSERSAAYIWGDNFGDTIADTILASLRTRGRMSRTELNSSLSGHVKAAQMDAALQMLLNGGRVQRSSEGSTGGRPMEFWEAAG